MSVQGSTSSNQINQIDPPLVSQENASGVKEHKPPTFQKAVNKLKRGFNNLVLSHNKRVVKRAYVKQEVEKNIKQFGGNGWAKANVRLFQKRNYKKDIATNFNTKALDLNFVKRLKGKELNAFISVLQNDSSSRSLFFQKNAYSLLMQESKSFFNSLPLSVKKDFIIQNKGIDDTFCDTFQFIYKDELKSLKNKELLAALPGDKQVQFCKTNGLDHRDYLDLNNHEVAQAWVKEYKEELLSPDNKAIFNNLPMEAKKAFIEQNKGDVGFLSTFSDIYKEELLKPENKDLFITLVKNLSGKGKAEARKTFGEIFMNKSEGQSNKLQNIDQEVKKEVFNVFKEELKDYNQGPFLSLDFAATLSDDNKKIYLNLPNANLKNKAHNIDNAQKIIDVFGDLLPEKIKNIAQKTIEEEKGKTEESAFKSFALGDSEINSQKEFQNYVLENKNAIIENPTILASVDKATLESIIEPIIKEDEQLGKALMQSFFTIDGAFVEKALTAEIKETDEKKFSDMKANEEKLLKLFNNEAPQPDDYTLGENIQLFADVARGYEFTFKGPDGGTITIKGGLGKSRPDLLRDVREQVNKENFSQEDINALSDFIAHCPTQGLFSAKIQGNTIAYPIHPEGDNMPMFNVNYSEKGEVKLIVETKGKSKQNYAMSTNNNIYCAVPTIKAKLTFDYDSNFGGCKAKAASITVNSFEQTLDDIFSV